MVAITGSSSSRSSSSVTSFVASLFFNNSSSQDGGTRKACLWLAVVLTLISYIYWNLRAAYHVDDDLMTAGSSSSTILFEAPINHMERVPACPKLAYKTDPAVWWNQKICIATLSDVKGRQRFWSKVILPRRLFQRRVHNVLDLTWSNKHQYAEEHKYDLFDESYKSLDPTRIASWSKVRAVRRLFTQEHCDWVMWLDPETVIMKSNVRMEELLPADDDEKDVVVTHDTRGGGYSTSVFIMRKTPWTLTFLDTWWNVTYDNPAWTERAAFNAVQRSLTRTDVETHFVVPPKCSFNSLAIWLSPEEQHAWTEGSMNVEQQEWFNSQWAYHKGDFIAHVSGVENSIKACEMLLHDAM